MNKRAREIIFWIMEKRDYQETCTINDLMDKFKVSERTIRYDLEGITDFLLENKQKPIQLCEHGVIELQKDTDAMLFTFALSNRCAAAGSFTSITHASIGHIPVLVRLMI